MCNIYNDANSINWKTEVAPQNRRHEVLLYFQLHKMGGASNWNQQCVL